METSSFQPQLPSFTGKDYDVWVIKMETMLKVHDVWDNVKFGFAEPQNDAEERALSNADREQWKKDKRKYEKALLLIQYEVDQAVFQKIMIMSSTKQAWETLATNYQGMAKVNIVKCRILEEILKVSR